MAMLNRYPNIFMDYEDNGDFNYFDEFIDLPVSPLSRVASAPAEIDYAAQQREDVYAPAQTISAPVVQSPLVSVAASTPAPSRYNISSPEVQAQVFAAQEAARQAEATRLAQEAEASRQAQLAEQARIAAEQRAYEDQQVTLRQEQARIEAAQRAEQERLAAEQTERERLGALQQAEMARQAEVERQGALQRAEAERQAEAAKRAEQERLTTTAAPVQDALTYLNSNPTGTPSPDQQKVIDDYFAANPININEDSFRNTFGGFDLNGGLKLNAPEEQKRLNELDKIVDPLTQQILGQGTSSKWTGAGYGSAEANARDMAKILAGIGITDISQFGKFTQTGLEAEVRPDGQGGFVDDKGNKVDASKVNQQTYSGESGDTTYYTAPVGTQEVYGNKITKQAVPITYGERQTGDAWGGTFEGSGNTGYRVQFDAAGNPIFYTTGASSSDIGQLAPFLAIASFIPGVAPFAQALNGAIALKNGDVLGGLASLAGAGGFTDAATGLRVAKALDNGDVGSLVSTLVQNPTISNIAGSTMLTDTISLKDAGTAFNVVNNVNNGNIAGALTSAGQLTGSSDVTTAGAALNVVNAIKSGNETAIINAVAGLNDTIKAADNISNPAVASTLSDNLKNGTNAFVQAKQAGATDAEALQVANTVTGSTDTTAAATTTQTSAATTEQNLAGGEFAGVDAAVAANTASNNTVIGNAEADNPEEAAYLAKQRNPTGTTFTFGGQTYTMGASNAQVQNTIDQAVTQSKIDDAKTFNEAYAAARSGLGAGKTFTWNGKQYSTSTAEERPDLAVTSIDLLNAKNLATTTDASKTVAAQSDTAAREAAAKDLAATQSAQNLIASNTSGQAVETGGYDALGNPIGGQTIDASPDLNTTSGKIANGVANAMNTFFGVVANTPVAAVQAGGNLLGNIGGVIDLVAGTSTDAGNKLRELAGQVDKFSDSISDPQIKAQQQKIGADIDKADGLVAKTAALMSSAYDNPLGAANWVFTEAFEEVPGVGMALKAGSKIARYGIAMANDMVESGGAAYNDTYKAAKAQGMTEAEARDAARNSSLIAMVATGATGGLVEGKILTKAIGKQSAGELVEGSAQAAGAQLALGQDLDVNKILTQGVIEMGVGKGASSTAGAVTATNIPGSAASTAGADETTGAATTGSTATNAATNTQASTDFSTIFLSTGDTGTAASSAVDTAISSGGDAATAVGSTITAAGETGSTANVTTALDSSVSTAISNGADVTSTIDTAVYTAAASGVSANVAAATAANAAASAGVDTTTASTVASKAAATVTASSASVVGADTATTASTNAATNAGTVVGTGVTSNTQVDANTNTATTTTTNTNTNTNTTVTTDANTNTTTTTNVNNNTNVTTNTVTDANTNTTTNTVTDANTGVTVNVNIDTITGEVVSVNGPGQVIDKDTVVVDGTPIDVNTGEILTPEEVDKRKKAAVTKTAVSSGRTPSVSGNLTFTEPTYKAKDSDISETWLGGRFRNIAPLAGMGILLPESTPMFQETQALSALRRAAGLEDGAEKPETDYYAYGSEPSYAKVLEPFMNGGTVQNHADGGKIMASPLMAASGGDVPHKGSHYVQGAGGGQDDLIPAKLADGEYVFDADIVAALGDGSNKEGAKKLDAMREAIRKHKRGGSVKSIPPKAKSPLAYLKGVL